MDCINFKFYSDESLESCLLRLSQHQGFERFAHFAEEMLYCFLDEHEAVSGALPFELKRINIYHAQVSRQLRVRAIRQLEADLELPKFQLLRLSLTRSNRIFSPDLKAVHRIGVDYPQAMLRPKHTPVCSHCLSEAPYIRQLWQLIPIEVCPQHECQLIHKCPQCSRSIDYQHSESIELCECGYRFADSSTIKAKTNELKLAKWLTNHASRIPNLPALMSISERHGFLLWYVNRYGDLAEIDVNSFVEYCEKWPEVLIDEVALLAKDGEIKLVKPWSKTFFTEVFAGLLKECRTLPHRSSQSNQVLQTVVTALFNVVEAIPTKKTGDVGDILLNILDASTILSCTTDEVYQLYELGEIKAVTRLPLHTKLPTHQSAFTLRSIIETKLALNGSEIAAVGFYLGDE